VYATAFVDCIRSRWGLEPIYFYTDPKTRFYRSCDESWLAPAGKSYFVEPRRMSEFLEHIRQHYDVAGVVPYNEATLLTAARINSELQLNWNSQDAIALFRDKYALKNKLRGRGSVRINRSWVVRSSQELFDIDDLPEHYVLKPNDGFGSKHIGFFERKTPRATIDEYLARTNRPHYVVEEFIGGEEYFLNGHIDRDGQVHFIAAFKYMRRPGNGMELYYATHKVDFKSEAFVQLRDYASAVMRELELTRSPFHMEIKIDADGPCLIEVGARLVGHNNAFACKTLHEDRLDPIAMAAADYLNLPWPELTFDWEAHDERSMLYVHGICEQEQWIYNLEGIEAASQVHGFDSWVVKPFVGQCLRKTVDLFTMPFSAVLTHRGPIETLQTSAGQVRSQLQWNQQVRPQSVLRVRAGNLWTRACTRAMWYKEKILDAPQRREEIRWST